MEWIENQPLSEAEMDAFKQQMLEGEKRLKEQSEAMTLQQQELERERRRLEETKNSNVDLTSLTSVLNSIQKDLSTLKTFNQRFQDLEKRMNDSITGDSITFTQITNKCILREHDHSRCYPS